jgi:hypothetical protein
MLNNLPTAEECDVCPALPFGRATDADSSNADGKPIFLLV